MIMKHEAEQDKDHGHSSKWGVSSKCNFVREMNLLFPITGSL